MMRIHRRDAETLSKNRFKVLGALAPFLAFARGGSGRNFFIPRSPRTLRGDSGSLPRPAQRSKKPVWFAEPGGDNRFLYGFTQRLCVSAVLLAVLATGLDAGTLYLGGRPNK